MITHRKIASRFLIKGNRTRFLPLNANSNEPFHPDFGILVTFDRLKKAVSYLLISSILIFQTELHEVFKVPALIAHFIEHCKDEKDLSFCEFLHEHYCHEHFKCNHAGENDHELPFQCCDFTHLIITGVISSPEQMSFPLFESHLTHVVSYAEQCVSKPEMDIWQPPRI